MILYNTLSNSKESFIPNDKNIVKIYTCGPTVYNDIHIGNLRTFLFEDILIRYLRYKGYQTIHVMNITDVDDKTIKKSYEQKILLKELTAKYTASFMRDIYILRTLEADYYPNATDHIKEMISLIKKIKDKGYAYELDNSVYFDISKFREYGKLANIKNLKSINYKNTLDEYNKEDANDFVLWKNYTKNDQDVYWSSPWGKGRPGWHIECSAMAEKYLGNNFDIHTGGIDNIFPHHENEIAQSSCISNKNLANYWVHSNFIEIDKVKISKSLNNVIYLKDLLKLFNWNSIRMSLIYSNYRTKIEFNNKFINDMDKQTNKIESLLISIIHTTSISNIKDTKDHDINLLNLIDDHKKKFTKYMDNDLNTPSAISLLFVLSTPKNKNILLNSSDKYKAIFIEYILDINLILQILQPELVYILKRYINYAKNKDCEYSKAILTYHQQIYERVNYVNRFILFYKIDLKDFYFNIQNLINKLNKKINRIKEEDILLSDLKELIKDYNLNNNIAYTLRSISMNLHSNEYNLNSTLKNELITNMYNITSQIISNFIKVNKRLIDNINLTYKNLQQNILTDTEIVNFINYTKIYINMNLISENVYNKYEKDFIVYLKRNNIRFNNKLKLEEELEIANEFINKISIDDSITKNIISSSFKYKNILNIKLNLIVNKLINFRENLRQNNQFKKSDTLRDHIIYIGYTVKDLKKYI